MQFYKWFQKNKEAKISSKLNIKNDDQKLNEIRERMNGKIEIKDENKFDDLQRKISSFNKKVPQPYQVKFSKMDFSL